MGGRCVCEYHIYDGVWAVDEVLQCERESHDTVNWYTVDSTVEHFDYEKMV